jgi:cytochrome c oxidase assembly protein subunit 15
VQVILGAGVAGLHAGLTYNTFPLMDGHWIPPGFWPNEIWYKNLFEDITTIQFTHRMVAYVLGILIPLFCVIGRNNPHVAHLLPILFSIFVIQFLLGVLTLLFVVPLPLASLHQTNALLLFAISVTIMHRLFIPLKFFTYDIMGKSALA